MTFPASTVTKETAWSSIRNSANKIKSRVKSLRDMSASGSTGRTSYLALQKGLAQAVESWNTYAVVPGLEEYARDQINDPTLALAAEFVAMRDAAIALKEWIFTAVPTDGSGALLTHTSDVDGNQTELMFTTAQTAGFRTQADIFIATVG